MTSARSGARLPTKPGVEWVCSPEQRAGLMVAVITGGRPKLKERLTAGFLTELRDAGFGNAAWIMNERDAPAYEQDGNEVITYTQEWAYEYASAHWMRVEAPEPDGFFGAFPGREWACRVAEERGYWGVLQLDDNIETLRFRRGTAASMRVVDLNGGMGLYADLLSGLALSTNAMMIGAQLAAVIPSKSEAAQIVRPGFPYSCFIEKVGEGREEWYGPYEDDITHSFQYGDRHDGVTAAVVPALTYAKESKSKTGMRAKYDSTRSVQLQRMMPQSVKIGIRATRSNGKGEPRVFHSMSAGAIRNPVTIRDRPLFTSVKSRLEAVTREWFELEKVANLDKVRRRLHASLNNAR